jgi:hypothetical protein
LAQLLVSTFLRNAAGKSLDAARFGASHPLAGCTSGHIGGGCCSFLSALRNSPSLHEKYGRVMVSLFTSIIGIRVRFTAASLIARLFPSQEATEPFSNQALRQ